MNRLISALRPRMRGEEGFTVTELAAAFAVLLLAIIALARTATVAFSDVSNARQRQTGNQLANQLMEEVRGLPFDTVKKGLSSTDLTGDANIVSCGGGVYRFRSCTTGERIIHTSGLPTTSPLVPHRGSVGPPTYPGTYSWSVYVTEATGSPAQGTYRVAVIVDWAGRARAGARSELHLETLVYSPQGCVDTATHPFGAPCQPYYYGSVNAGGGNLAVTGAFDGDEPIESMTATLLGVTADAQVEQVSLVQGNVSLPEISEVDDGTETLVSDGAFSSADSDPSTPSGTYSTATAGPQSSGDLRLQDGPNKLDLVANSGSQGATTSTTSAGGTNACNLQVDGLPCGYGRGTQSGGLALSVDLQDGGTTTLASVGTSSTPVTTYVRRSVPVAGQNGFLGEQISWTVPEIRLGGVPSDINPPSGWQGYWVRLRNFTATATAQAGTSSAAPTVTVSGGTIDYWHGNSYNSVTVADPSTGAPRSEPFTVPINTFQQQTTVQGDQLRVEMSGVVTIEPSAVTETLTGTNVRTEAEALIGAPMVVDMDYVVTADGDPVFELSMLLTAGQGAASATYRPTATG